MKRVKERAGLVQQIEKTCDTCANRHSDKCEWCFSAQYEDGRISEPSNWEAKKGEIKDSGARTEFPSGAVRDMQEDKGACELMPLDVVAEFMPNLDTGAILNLIERFKMTGDSGYLFEAVRRFFELRGWNVLECLLEVSIHYKQGMEKYGAYNWQRGIPVSSFISSAVRHFLRFVYNENDERHDRAFVWNMFGAMWTMKHRPEMIDIPFELLGTKESED